MSDGPSAKLEMPVDLDRMLDDMRMTILSEIDDYCILFGTNALPALREYIEKATTGWTRRPDPSLVEEE